MGYRSEVAIALDEDAAILLKALTKHSKTLQEIIDDCHVKTGWHDDDRGTTKLFWESIKWYESYKDVECILEFLSQIEEEEYYFIRLGEETDDIEHAGQFYESDMYVQRSIVL